MNIDLTPFFQALIGLLAAAITCLVIPWIHARTTEAQQANLKAVIRVLVYAAEQMFGGGAGEQKLNFVREQLQERGYDVQRGERGGVPLQAPLRSRPDIRLRNHRIHHRRRAVQTS